jgi:hypothetical protein
MSTQESERLGGAAPIRISAREHVNGGEPERGGLHGLTLSAELLVFVVGVVALLIVAAVDSGVGAERAWTLITVLAAAYILRRR